MPLTTATPEVIAQINHWQVGMFSVTLRGDTPSYYMEIDRGYEDEEGTVTPVDTVPVAVSGAEFAAIFMSTTTGDTLYNEIKTRQYVLAKAKGAVPEEAAEA